MTRLFLFIVCLCASSLNAQEFYLKAGTGYALPMPGQTRDGFGNLLNGSLSSVQGRNNFQLKTASFSSGLQGIIGGGYMFSNHIGLELNTAINLAPKKYTFTNRGLIQNGNLVDVAFTRQVNQMIVLMPAVVLQTAKEKWNLYMRMGIALPFNTDIKMHDIYSYYSGIGQTDDYYWRIKNYFSLGFTGAAGIKYKVSENIAIWGEVSMLYLSLSRKEADLDGLTVNSINYDLAKVKGVKAIYYNKSGTTDTSGGPQQQTFAQPFSNLEINAGITYTFPHHSKIKSHLYKIGPRKNNKEYSE